MNIHEQEEFDFQPSSEAEWDRFDTELGAYNRGDTESEWILSDRDVWYRNPLFAGKPSGTHPEDEYDIREQAAREDAKEAWLSWDEPREADDDSCPF